jgi:N-glycosylase/DNA lyase
LELDASQLHINPSHTFSCGQAFRWHPLDQKGSKWIGVVGRNVLAVTRDTVKIYSDNSEKNNDEKERIMDYFAFDEDLHRVFQDLPKDPYLLTAIQEFEGLRLLSQDPWECLVSFLCSINKNIPSIQRIIENLCNRFGERIETDVGKYRSFPSPQSLANSKESDLLSCKVGFRSKYLRFIAKKIVSGELDLDKLKDLSYEQAKGILVSKISGKTFGVGNKVADCALLFSLKKREAFPIDVWMLRCIRSHYAKRFEINVSALKSLSPKNYEIISKDLRSYFGKHSGYAQQYLYMKTRTDAIYSR